MFKRTQSAFAEMEHLRRLVGDPSPLKRDQDVWEQELGFGEQLRGIQALPETTRSGSLLSTIAAQARTRLRGPNHDN